MARDTLGYRAIPAARPASLVCQAASASRSDRSALVMQTARRASCATCRRVAAIAASFRCCGSCLPTCCAFHASQRGRPTCIDRDGVRAGQRDHPRRSPVCRERGRRNSGSRYCRGRFMATQRYRRASGLEARNRRRCRHPVSGNQISQDQAGCPSAEILSPCGRSDRDSPRPQ